MADTEGFMEDAESVFNGAFPVPASGNKYPIGFDFSGADPAPDKFYPHVFSTGENDFPRQTGTDSLSTDEDLLT